ncbi:hypothetical protein GCM10023188_15570 [Pontibacter saemangeumensis]|uniref:Uncharacterized protein n=1 Tax=Pontibacter saemangeumensis TaxID=1084525 RepID=A0ABP8LIM8_9BACT
MHQNGYVPGDWRGSIKRVSRFEAFLMSKQLQDNRFYSGNELKVQLFYEDKRF